MYTQERHGLRERKKRLTRKTISRAALELFVRQGYGRTTITEIAAAADVSPRTVSTYFPAKEDLVFGSIQAQADRLREALAARPAGEHTMAAVRAWVVGEQKEGRDKREEFGCLRQIVEQDEALSSLFRARIHEFELLVGEGIARDLGLAAEDLEPRMAASAAVAVFDLLGENEQGSPEPGEALSGDQLRRLDQAIAFIDGGVRALLDAGADAPVKPGSGRV